MTLREGGREGGSEGARERGSEGAREREREREKKRKEREREGENKERNKERKTSTYYILHHHTTRLVALPHDRLPQQKSPFKLQHFRDHKLRLTSLDYLTNHRVTLHHIALRRVLHFTTSLHPKHIGASSVTKTTI